MCLVAPTGFEPVGEFLPTTLKVLRHKPLVDSAILVHTEPNWKDMDINNELTLCRRSF